VNLTFSSPSKWRERGGGLLFALLFNGLLLLALLTLAPKPVVRLPDFRNPVTFEMAPAPKAEKAQSKAEKSEKKQQEKSAQRQVRPVVKPDRPVVRPTEQQPSPLPFLVMDRQQMASADIGKMAKQGAADGASGQGNSAAAAGPGEGPGGVQLFEAEWYRRPSPAELGGYLPANAPGNGWGLVACMTVDHYHVENCQALGESPVGSGFAKAVRLAAWQFLVLPPRVNGKVMVGSWVRIRIDYSRTVAGADEAGR
jgi:protein TonB